MDYEVDYNYNYIFDRKLLDAYAKRENIIIKDVRKYLFWDEFQDRDEWVEITRKNSLYNIVFKFVCNWEYFNKIIKNKEKYKQDRLDRVAEEEKFMAEMAKTKSSIKFKDS